MHTLVGLGVIPISQISGGIPKALCSLKYITVDSANEHIRQIGHGTLLVKIDIKSTFRLLPFLGITLDTQARLPENWAISNKGYKKRYIVISRPFAACYQGGGSWENFPIKNVLHCGPS